MSRRCHAAGPALLEQDWCIAQDAGFVSKKWRTVALVAQRSAVKAMRAAFFAAVAENVQRKCLDAWLLSRGVRPQGKCVLRHVGVTTTVVAITVHAHRAPPVIAQAGTRPGPILQLRLVAKRHEILSESQARCLLELSAEPC